MKGLLFVESLVDEKGELIDADFGLLMRGDSMRNARIMDGDIVFIKQAAYKDGDIVAVSKDEEIILRRYYKDNDSGIVTLLAGNPAYAPMVYDELEFKNFLFLGKAVAIQSKL